MRNDYRRRDLIWDSRADTCEISGDFYSGETQVSSGSVWSHCCLKEWYHWCSTDLICDFSFLWEEFNVSLVPGAVIAVSVFEAEDVSELFGRTCSRAGRDLALNWGFTIYTSWSFTPNQTGLAEWCKVVNSARRTTRIRSWTLEPGETH